GRVDQDRGRRGAREPVALRPTAASSREGLGARDRAREDQIERDDPEVVGRVKGWIGRLDGFDLRRPVLARARLVALVRVVLDRGRLRVRAGWLGGPGWVLVGTAGADGGGGRDPRSGEARRGPGAGPVVRPRSSRASAQLPRGGSTGRSPPPGTSRSSPRTPATPSYFYDCGPDAVKVVARPPQPPRQMVDYLSIVRASRPHFQRTVYTPDHGTGSSGLGGLSPSDRIDLSVRATTPSRGRTARSWTRTREAGWLQGWRWSCQRAAGRRTAGRFARSAWGHAK